MLSLSQQKQVLYDIVMVRNSNSLLLHPIHTLQFTQFRRKHRLQRCQWLQARCDFKRVLS